MTATTVNDQPVNIQLGAESPKTSAASGTSSIAPSPVLGAMSATADVEVVVFRRIINSKNPVFDQTGIKEPLDLSGRKPTSGLMMTLWGSNSLTRQLHRTRKMIPCATTATVSSSMSWSSSKSRGMRFSLMKRLARSLIDASGSGAMKVSPAVASGLSSEPGAVAASLPVFDVDTVRRDRPHRDPSLEPKYCSLKSAVKMGENVGSSLLDPGRRRRGWFCSRQIPSAVSRARRKSDENTCLK